MACFNKIQLIIFVLSITFATLSRHAISTILSSNSTILNNSSPPANDALAPAKRHVYIQILDHLNSGYTHLVSFNQIYYIDSSYWVGAQANGPILVFFGGEGPISYFVNRIGIMNLSAPKLGALIVYIEHRFYGESVPLRSIDEAMNDPDTRNCLNVEQALADFADIIKHIKQNLSAPNSPVIVIGGSYAGMLAVWFRLRYPSLSIGALASSAPLLNFGVIAPQHQNCWIVSQDFKQKSEKCYNIIRQSWTIIDTVASQPNGLTSLSHQFRTCKPLSSAWDLKSYLSDLYLYYAQYDTPTKNLVSGFCKIIVNPSNGDIIQGIASAVNKMLDNCNNLNDPSPSGSTQFGLDYASRAPWNWQKIYNEPALLKKVSRRDCCSQEFLCTEIVITSEEYCGDDTLLLPNTRNSSVLSEFCSEAFGVRPDPLWMSSHFYFGDDVLIALNKYSSNIIFSNGLRDPFSGTGILEDISKTIIALKTDEGTHCLDLNDIHKDDPKWLKKQRKKELHIFKKWIHQHSGAFTNKHTLFTAILNLFVVNYFYYLLW